MIIENLLVRENELMDNGNLELQITVDLMKYIESRKKYQEEHLDAKVKPTGTSSYDKWTSDNQKKITYMERILELFTRGKIAEDKEKNVGETHVFEDGSYTDKRGNLFDKNGSLLSEVGTVADFDKYAVEVQNGQGYYAEDGHFVKYSTKDIFGEDIC